MILEEGTRIDRVCESFKWMMMLHKGACISSDSNRLMVENEIGLKAELIMRFNELRTRKVKDVKKEIEGSMNKVHS